MLFNFRQNVFHEEYYHISKQLSCISDNVIAGFKAFYIFRHRIINEYYKAVIDLAYGCEIITAIIIKIGGYYAIGAEFRIII